jgi:cell division septation protein DedD
VIFALLAFVCGVQMGKSLTEAPVPAATVSALREEKGKAPPFRIVEKGKPSHPVQESGDRGPNPADSLKEKTSEPPKALPTSAVASPSAVSAEKNPPPPEEEKPRPPKAKYSLQVAALNNATEAQELVTQLKKKGYEAYEVTGTAAAKGTLHRVRIGQFQTLQEARQFALAFEKKENRKPIIASLP